jgi:hypothetical protein
MSKQKGKKYAKGNEKGEKLERKGHFKVKRVNNHKIGKIKCKKGYMRGTSRKRGKSVVEENERGLSFPEEDGRENIVFFGLICSIDPGVA